MSGIVGAQTARALVEVTSSQSPSLTHHCPRCDQPRRFESSGKFRVNASGKKIDAWLIFRCMICDHRWNRPVHERRPVASLAPLELEALMRNDPALARRHAAIAGMDGDPAPEVARTILEPATSATSWVEITIAIQRGCDIRLDRLLALTLLLPRVEIHALGKALEIAPASAKALRRPACDRQHVRLDLLACGRGTADRCRTALGAAL